MMLLQINYYGGGLAQHKDGHAKWHWIVRTRRPMVANWHAGVPIWSNYGLCSFSLHCYVNIVMEKGSAAQGLQCHMISEVGGMEGTAPARVPNLEPLHAIEGGPFL